MAWRLVGSQSGAAQDVGGAVFAAHPEWARGIATERLVDLALHDTASVRDAARALFPRIVDRFRAATSPEAHREMMALLRVLNCSWDDARAFWFAVFRERFDAADLTPSILVALC